MLQEVHKGQRSLSHEILTCCVELPTGKTRFKVPPFHSDRSSSSQTRVLLKVSSVTLEILPPGGEMFNSIAARVCVQVQAFLEPLRLPLEKLQDVSARLKTEMDRGLGRCTHRNASVKMLPTFVSATPDGTGETGLVSERKLGKTEQKVSVSAGLIFYTLLAEKGDFLALDLGGSNLRVYYVRVMEDEKKVLEMKSQLPPEIKLGPGKEVKSCCC